MDNLILLALGLTSLVTLMFIIERGWALRHDKVIPPALIDQLTECRARADVAVLQTACERNPSVLGSLLAVAAEHLDWPKEDNEDAVQMRARQEIVKLERGLVVLEVAVGIAPLLGLVGTIYGMMTLFRGLGQSAANDNAALASGIAVILQSTMLGLLIAIPSLVAWSYFSKKVETLTVELETLCGEFLRRQYREGKK
jgi:biopolymer transport protein ExbB